MKITDAPGEIDVEDMLPIFIAILEDTTVLPKGQVAQARMESEGSFSEFCDHETQMMWIGFALGQRSRDRVNSIPKSRTHCHDPANPALLQIGIFITSLSKTLEAAGVARYEWEQWRIDGRIIINAYCQILGARGFLHKSFVFSSPGGSELDPIQESLLDANRQLGVAVDLPELKEPGG